ncbi:ATP-binding cassette domain-containing protein [Rickettsiales endosymbiont of Stachyamoeba lipophora]|uniref:ATP-binding cassette domain-containing protein n=1 Tax=Rickettsiales endosymbiont of Stachyamoeba lipophora TaxID=2486578 RepID=UPI000F654272|nr:ATP-binding cassette domain-containing protein [Rickettsiales endosymbiont of Stachyamoeba lipophora]AZL16011.1 ATP-binding cassette domain-containing protein [Rickettsiales endosymbiont of Stachyamoeba lipophora]
MSYLSSQFITPTDDSSFLHHYYNTFIKPALKAASNILLRKEVISLILIKIVCYTITGIISGFTAGFILDTIVAQLNQTSALSVKQSIITILSLTCFNFGINEIGNQLESYSQEQLRQQIEEFVENHELMNNSKIKKYIDSIETVKKSSLQTNIIKSFSHLSVLCFTLAYDPFMLLVEFFLINKISNLLFIKFKIQNNAIIKSNLGKFLPYGLSFVLLAFELGKVLIRAKLYDELQIQTTEDQLRNITQNKSINKTVAKPQVIDNFIKFLKNKLEELTKYKIVVKLLNGGSKILQLSILFVHSITQPFKIIQEIIETLTGSQKLEHNLDEKIISLQQYTRAVGEDLKDFIGSDKALLRTYRACLLINPELMIKDKAIYARKIEPTDRMMSKRRFALIDLKRLDTQQNIAINNLVVKFLIPNPVKGASSTHITKEIKYKNLEFSKGHLITIEGKNATGKSTFLKVLAEQYHISGSQNARVQLPKDTSFAFLSLNNFNSHFKYLQSAANFRATADTLTEFSDNNTPDTSYPELKKLLTDLQTTPAETYSDGQKTAIMIISALTALDENNQKIYQDIIVDEAASALSKINDDGVLVDGGARREAMNLLRKYAEKQQKFVFVVDHNLAPEDKQGTKVTLDTENEIVAYSAEGAVIARDPIQTIRI